MGTDRPATINQTIGELLRGDPCARDSYVILIHKAANKRVNGNSQGLTTGERTRSQQRRRQAVSRHAPLNIYWAMGILKIARLSL